MKVLHCWRCRVEIPMLEDDEWRIVQAPMRRAERAGTPARREPAPSSDEPPVDPIFQAGLDAYEQITAVRETVFAAMAHHIVGGYGPACHNCGRPLRTHQATLCEGGAHVPGHALVAESRRPGRVVRHRPGHRGREVVSSDPAPTFPGPGCDEAARERRGHLRRSLREPDRVELLVEVVRRGHGEPADLGAVGNDAVPLQRVEVVHLLVEEAPLEGPEVAPSLLGIDGP
jgi:hypothetical protein